MIFIYFLGATDIWQPVDSGYGYLVKKLIAKAQDEWLELEDNVDKWMGHSKNLSASDRRILITQWVGEAYEKINSPDYDHFRWRCFQKTGCLITANGSEDKEISPEGLENYEVIPPLPMPGPNDIPAVEVPEAASEPLDTIEKDDLFTSLENEEALDLESDEKGEERIEDFSPFRKLIRMVMENYLMRSIGMLSRCLEYRIDIYQPVYIPD